MRKKIISIFIISFLFLQIQYLFAQQKFHAQIPDVPAIPALVNDFAKMMSAEEVFSLETKLLAYEQESSNEIAIVTVNDLGGLDIVQYSVELGRKWNIGKASKKNGVLLLASKEERKIFIAPATGLQGALPDMICNKIIREQIVPNFKQGKFYDGFNEAVNQIILYSKGEFTADETSSSEDSSPYSIFLFVLLIFMVFFIISWFISKHGGTYVSRKGYKNNDDDFWGGGSSSWGSGSSWGGGSSSGRSGGFGGFGGGGGGFNGGGSGGSW